MEMDDNQLKGEDKVQILQALRNADAAFTSFGGTVRSLKAVLDPWICSWPFQTLHLNSNPVPPQYFCLIIGLLKWLEICFYQVDPSPPPTGKGTQKAEAAQNATANNSGT